MESSVWHPPATCHKHLKSYGHCSPMCTDVGKEDSPAVTPVPSSQHLLPGMVNGQLGQSQEISQMSWDFVRLCMGVCIN